MLRSRLAHGVRQMRSVAGSFVDSRCRDVVDRLEFSAGGSGMGGAMAKHLKISGGQIPASCRRQVRVSAPDLMAFHVYIYSKPTTAWGT